MITRASRRVELPRIIVLFRRRLLGLRSFPPAAVTAEMSAADWIVAECESERRRYGVSDLCGARDYSCDVREISSLIFS